MTWRPCLAYVHALTLHAARLVLYSFAADLYAYMSSAALQLTSGLGRPVLDDGNAESKVDKSTCAWNRRNSNAINLNYACTMIVPTHQLLELFYPG